MALDPPIWVNPQARSHGLVFFSLGREMTKLVVVAAEGEGTALPPLRRAISSDFKSETRVLEGYFQFSEILLSLYPPQPAHLGRVIVTSSPC
ncbi:hypothetical protein CRG98_020317 [Punica granatum]|uniref:Uncharacterized protein n=1 Tax=Punica granatum TaxID=22663 RepID=A0A2I0JSK8_PUNGR|nr:hypothetical protein CRG98_020317 [Punica granatum]